MAPACADAVTLGMHAGEGAFVVVEPHVIGYRGRPGSEASQVRVQHSGAFRVGE